MPTTETLLAAVQAAKIISDLYQAHQAGQVSDEEFLERWQTIIVPRVQSADDAWVAAGQS